jgi:hypothetical protein
MSAVCRVAVLMYATSGGFSERFEEAAIHTYTL